MLLENLLGVVTALLTKVLGFVVGGLGLLS